MNASELIDKTIHTNMKKTKTTYYGYNVGGQPRSFGHSARYVVVKKGSEWFSYDANHVMESMGDKEDWRDYNSFVRQKTWLPFDKLPF